MKSWNLWQQQIGNASFNENNKKAILQYLETSNSYASRRLKNLNNNVDDKIEDFWKV